ncbi:MAG: endonuclease III domain-containing protein [Thiohalomonadaceae bacterium]|jgi:endonuclease-3 related protein
MTPYQVYTLLREAYGSTQWWPAETAFEVMVGAILTQNTTWSNVEKAITNLKANAALEPTVILHTDDTTLAGWIRSSGYYNIKAGRLKNYCRWYLAAGGYTELQNLETAELRKQLLEVKGVGHETADDILLYAFARPVFVIDAYTRRLFSRLQLITGLEKYDELRHYFEQGLSHCDRQVELFNEYHALIVMHAKQLCRKRPLCRSCGLQPYCNYELE